MERRRPARRLGWPCRPTSDNRRLRPMTNAVRTREAIASAAVAAAVVPPPPPLVARVACTTTTHRLAPALLSPAGNKSPVLSTVVHASLLLAAARERTRPSAERAWAQILDRPCCVADSVRSAGEGTHTTAPLLAEGVLVVGAARRGDVQTVCPAPRCARARAHPAPLVAVRLRADLSSRPLSPLHPQ